MIRFRSWMLNGSMPASASAMEVDTVRKTPVMIPAAVFWMMSSGLVIQYGISKSLLMDAHTDAAYVIVGTISALYNWRAVRGPIPLSLASAWTAWMPLLVTLPTCSLNRSS